MARFLRRSEDILLWLSPDEYDKLLLALGLVTGLAAGAGRPDLMWEVLQVANMINDGNSQFTPYEIPAEYRWKRPAVQ